MEDDQHLRERLNKLEQETASMKTSVDGLIDTVKTISTDIKSIKDGSKTDWKTLAAWATVIIMIMGYYGNITQEPLKVKIENLTNTIKEMKAAPIMNYYKEFNKPAP